jgi:hypothetical protein
MSKDFLKNFKVFFRQFLPSELTIYICEAKNPLKKHKNDMPFKSPTMPLESILLLNPCHYPTIQKNKLVSSFKSIVYVVLVKHWSKLLRPVLKRIVANTK